MANSTGEIPSYLGIYLDLSPLPHESTLLQNSHFREKIGNGSTSANPDGRVTTFYVVCQLSAVHIANVYKSGRFDSKPPMRVENNSVHRQSGSQAGTAAESTDYCCIGFQ